MYIHIYIYGVGALWDCVPLVDGGGGGCAGGDVPVGVVPALSWCGKVSLGSKTYHNSVKTAKGVSEVFFFVISALGKHQFGVRVRFA